MKVAVTMMLVRAFFPELHHGTSLETRMSFARFQTELEARLLAGGGPHSSRNSWQPQAVTFNQ